MIRVDHFRKRFGASQMLVSIATLLAIGAAGLAIGAFVLPKSDD